MVRGADQRAPRARPVDLATDRTRNARMIRAMPPARVKIPTSQTRVRMPLAGQINSSTPKTTVRMPAASVQPHAFDPRRRAANAPPISPTPERIAHRR